MYLEHFGLTQLPFSTTPDTRFFYPDASHKAALNVILFALRSGEGFIKVVGEVGTGKTLLCRLLLDRLRGNVVTAYIPNPYLNPNALRLALADELGVEAPRNLGQHRLLQRLSDRLMALAREGTRVVVVVDEAQAMPDETLEALRLLSNLETESSKLMQLVLFGQPELGRRLERVRQLRQRITFSYQLEPLNRSEIHQYLAHRMQVAGCDEPALFNRGAVRVIRRGSGGLPRLVNILGHKALMAAYGRGEHRVTARHARRAVADTEGALRRGPRGFALASSALALVGLVGWGVVYGMGLL